MAIKKKQQFLAARRAEERCQRGIPQVPGGQRGPSWLRQIVVAAGVGLLFGSLAHPSEIIKSWSVLSREVDNWSQRRWEETDRSWTGIWSSAPEGYRDYIELVGGFFELELSTRRGEISGRISSLTLCDNFPLHQEWMVKGRVYNNSAEVTFYDYMGALRVELRSPNSVYSLALKKSDLNPTIIEVANETIEGLIPRGSRVRLHPKEQERPSRGKEGLRGHCELQLGLYMDEQLRNLPDVDFSYTKRKIYQMIERDYPVLGGDV